MPPRYVFFDLHGTIIDSARLSEIYARTLGGYMAQRYGGSPEAWASANRAVMADWASYQADLDLSGDEGFADYNELLIRTTRAMFRLVGISEPVPSDIHKLAWSLGGIASQGGDALYPEARPVLRTLFERGYHLGVATHSPSHQAEGTLIGAKVRQWFQAPLFGTDSLERFDKDTHYWHSLSAALKVEPTDIAVVEDTPLHCQWAKQAGCLSIHLQRAGKPPAPPMIDAALTELSELLNVLK